MSNNVVGSTSLRASSYSKEVQFLIGNNAQVLQQSSYIPHAHALGKATIESYSSINFSIESRTTRYPNYL